MRTKFSEDVVPLTGLKVNPGKIVHQVRDTHRPVLLTSRGRGVAVVQGLEEYERGEEERAFLKAVTEGLLDVKEGREIDLDEAKERLGIAK